MPTSKISQIVVRAPNWIGDAVMSTPALMDLRENYPDACITLWARPIIAELLQDHPSIDQVLVYDYQGQHSGFSGKIRLIQRLRSHSFHVAVLLQNAFEAALLTFLAGIAERWGYATDGRNFLLTKSIPVHEKKNAVHQVQYFQSLIQALTGRTTSRSLQLVASDTEEQLVNERFPELRTKNNDVLIGINPGSVYGTAKRWLPERFAELTNRVIAQIHRMDGSKKKVKCVLVGGSGEEPLARTIAAFFDTEPIVLSGKTSLRDLMIIIKRCSLFITNDTGPMHIAAAFNVPIVAVFGSTDPHHTSPFGAEDSIIRSPVRCSPCFLRYCPIDHRCMTQVSVQQAYDKAMLHIQGKVEDERGS